VTRWLTTVLVYTSAFVGAGLFATACDPSYQVTSFRCDPSNPNCPTDKFASGGSGKYVCCSDDAAAMDLMDPTAPVLPEYMGGQGTGTPLFSGPQNNLSTSGFCIDLSVVPLSAAIQDPGSGQGCPLPCNPTWSAADVADVCGGGTVCCQTQELGELDCGLDPALGDMGCWRPVTGGDIMGLSGGLDVSNWSSSDHDTHQDPNGKGCLAFIAAAGGNTEARDECFRRLSVANQRGFCQSGVCPLTDPAYIDACEAKNQVEGRTNCPTSP
jgi:hypothetical protein